MSDNNWKAMTAQEACDVLDFWAKTSWPMDLTETITHAAQLGWTAEEEDDGERFLVNEVSGLSIPEVDAIEMPSGEIATISLRSTDAIREITPESTAFLNDQYTLLYREAATRWGAGEQSDIENGGRYAQWDLENGGRIGITVSTRSVSISFDTPQYAKVLRELGE